MRYLLASLKPFARLTFWGPLGLLSLGLIFYWQYQQHPEWLNQITEQPETLDSYFRSPSVPSNQPNAVAPNAQTPQNATNDPNNPDQGQWATEWKKGLTQQQIIPYSINQTKNPDQSINNPQKTQTSTLFRPLLPPVKQSNQPPAAVKPYQVQSAPISENYLKTAVEQIPTSNRSSYYNTNVAPVNSGQPYNTYNPNQSYQGVNQPVNQPVNPAVTGYQPPYSGGYANPPVAAPGYQPPNYGSVYARPNNPAYAVPQTQPRVSPNQPGYQVQPTITPRAAGF
ncbi:hypothetical protein C7H19_06680 [Aphanothece hegewaldii CCALA 016]|uniref:Uncharacterized protein n=2 Tax=Aphanothece TaxID=1121 RepID=A0A2T1M0F3_9CHRO|nr:hypothetical protein C7H19_06680 [Aphanothece hegewaldii CCALA 016]